MRIFLAAALIALMAGSANAQGQVPAHGNTAKSKSPQEIQGELDAEKAYKRSLGNIPDQGPTDPWGNVRGDSAPKAVTKIAPSKKSNTGNTAN